MSSFILKPDWELVGYYTQQSIIEKQIKEPCFIGFYKIDEFNKIASNIFPEVKKIVEVYNIQGNNIIDNLAFLVLHIKTSDKIEDWDFWQDGQDYSNYINRIGEVLDIIQENKRSYGKSKESRVDVTISGHDFNKLKLPRILVTEILSYLEQHYEQNKHLRLYKFPKTVNWEGEMAKRFGKMVFDFLKNTTNLKKTKCYAPGYDLLEFTQYRYTSLDAYQQAMKRTT